MKKTFFKQPIITNLKKRKNKIYDFYYLTYGQIIRKKRLEMKRTQEDIACSICSNTYISKAENNQVVIGDEQLNLIMERLDISTQEFANPEELIHHLGKVIQYYYYRDIDNYHSLIEKIDGYHFHALVELFKLGYKILNKDYDHASKIYNQLLDYLSSLDDVAFELFLIFSADLCMHMNQLHLAKYLIDSVYIAHMDFIELKPMYLYSKYRIYGRLDFPIQATDVYHQLMMLVSDTGNAIVLHELMVYRAIFSELYDKSKDIKYFNVMFKNVDNELIDEYLIIKAFKADNPSIYVNQMKEEDSLRYLIGLYLKARNALKNKEQKNYEMHLSAINAHPCNHLSKVDFGRLLNLEASSEWTFYKDYLINPCLKLAKEKQSIFFIKYVSDKISSVLEENNRYKDALNYIKQTHKNIHKIRFNQT